MTGGVPAVALSLLDRAQDHDLSSLELVTFGGAPSPLSLPDRMFASELGAMPGQGWGMTETSATCTSHSGQDYLHRPASCGPALPVCRLKVMEGGRELPPGDAGRALGLRSQYRERLLEQARRHGRNLPRMAG